MASESTRLPTVRAVRSALIDAAQYVFGMNVGDVVADGRKQFFKYEGKVVLEGYKPILHAVRWNDGPLDYACASSEPLFSIKTLPETASAKEIIAFKKRVNALFANTNVFQDYTASSRIAPETAAPATSKGTDDFVLRGILDLVGTKPRKGDTVPHFHMKDSPVLVVVVPKKDLPTFTAAQQALEDKATRASNDVFNLSKPKFAALSAGDAQVLQEEFNKGLVAGTRELNICFKVCALFFFSSFFSLQST
jgi:hypothetical protein